MCLEKLEDYEVKRKTGYKIILKRVSAKYKTATTSLQGRRISLDRWVTDRKKRPVTEMGLTYPTGFHVFLSREGAKSWCKGDSRTEIVKVDFDDVVATGYQYGFYDGRLYKVIVARKIYIHKPQEK